MAEDALSPLIEIKIKEKDDGEISCAVEDSFRSCPESSSSPILVAEVDIIIIKWILWELCGLSVVYHHQDQSVIVSNKSDCMLNTDKIDEISKRSTDYTKKPSIKSNVPVANALQKIPV